MIIILLLKCNEKMMRQKEEKKPIFRKFRETRKSRTIIIILNLKRKGGKKI